MPLADITEGSSGLLTIVYGQNVVMRNSCEREGESMEENFGAVMVILPPPPPPQICLNNHSCAAAARAIPDAPAAQYSARL